MLTLPKQLFKFLHLYEEYREENNQKPTEVVKDKAERFVSALSFFAIKAASYVVDTSQMKEVAVTQDSLDEIVSYVDKIISKKTSSFQDKYSLYFELRQKSVEAQNLSWVRSNCFKTLNGMADLARKDIQTNHSDELTAHIEQLKADTKTLQEKKDFDSKFELNMVRLELALLGIEVADAIKQGAYTEEEIKQYQGKRTLPGGFKMPVSYPQKKRFLLDDFGSVMSNKEARLFKNLTDFSCDEDAPLALQDGYAKYILKTTYADNISETFDEFLSNEEVVKEKKQKPKVVKQVVVNLHESENQDVKVIYDENIDQGRLANFAKFYAQYSQNNSEGMEQNSYSPTNHQ